MGKLTVNQFKQISSLYYVLSVDAATTSPPAKPKPFNVGPSFCPKEIKNYARISGRCFSLGRFFPEFGDPFWEGANFQDPPRVDPFSRLQLVINGKITLKTFGQEVFGQMSDVKFLILSNTIENFEKIGQARSW